MNAALGRGDPLQPLAERICRHFPLASDSAAGALASVRAMLAALAGKGAALGVALLRTWLKAWATHHRCQHGVHRCRVGCGAADGFDQLPHAVGCPRFEAAVAEAVGLRPPNNWAERIGLDPGPRSVSGPRRRRIGAPERLTFLTAAVAAFHTLLAAPGEIATPAALTAAARDAVRRMVC